MGIRRQKILFSSHLFQEDRGKNITLEPVVLAVSE